MNELITALGLVLVIEGLFWAAAPDFARSMALQAAGLPDHRLRIIGTIAVAIGVVIVWLVRG